MEPPLFLSYKKATILKVKHKKNNIVIPVLIFLSVMFGLAPDISLMDPRNALRLSEDDRRKNNTVIPVLFFFPVMFGLEPNISFWIAGSSSAMTILFSLMLDF